MRAAAARRRALAGRAAGRGRERARQRWSRRCGRSGARGGVEGLIQEYALSSQEGVALMCLAEALLRIPDRATRDALIRDKIAPGDWQRACRPQPLAVRQCRDLGAGGHRQADRDASSETGLSRALTRLIGRGGEPLIRTRRRHGDADDGRAVRHRPDDRRGARQRARARGRAASAIPTTCSARRRRPRRTPRAIYATTKRRSTPSARPRRGAASTKAPASRSSCRRCIRAIPARKRERVMAELLPRVKALAAAGQALRHRPQHRRRGGRPAGDLARSAGSALLRARTCRLERHRLRGAGLSEALPFRDRLDLVDLARRTRPPADGAAGQGRLLGLRDQARAGRRARRFSGLHAQGPHRRLLSRLRAQAARRRPTRSSRSSPPTTRRRWRAIISMAGANFYRGQYEFQCLHGMGEPLYEEVVGADKLGPALPHLCAGRHARDAARLSGAAAAGERRQHLVRQPHRRPDACRSRT